MNRDEKRLTVVEHLSELRRRIIVAGIAVVFAGAAAYVFVDLIIEILVAPSARSQFIALSPPELFLAHVRLSVVVGLVVSLPVTIGQAWLFVRPGLTRRERKLVVVSLALGSVLFAVGALFCYVVVLPTILEFFAGFSSETLEARYSFGAYVGFVLTTLTAFGVAFELPVVLSAAVGLGVLPLEALRRARKYVAVLVVVAAAALTPPDVVSQLLLAVPMYLLYELSVLVSAVIRRSSSADTD